MSSLRSVDLSLIDEILRGGEKGYVLDFSNRTFADFFVRELNIDIDAPEYAAEGSSKAKRLRCFLGKVDDGTAARALRALWEHREALRRDGEDDPLPRAAGQYAALIAKLEGVGPTSPANVVTAPAIETIEYDRFRTRLLSIRDLPPQQRGYDFERFLKDLFDAFRLAARDPFRLVGEQIDGSFELAGQTYLVEAKWLNRKVGVAELGAFHSKLDQKALWARGCSSVLAVSPMKAFRALAAAGGSSRWTGAISTKASRAASLSTASLHVRCVMQLRPARFSHRLTS